MRKCRVSVIVSAYNIRNYIVKIIEDLSNETIEDAEFIIIDDGSTDGTVDAIKKRIRTLNDSRFSIYVRHHQGVSATRNYGISIAKGTYLIFLDGDDRIEKRLVSNYLKKIEINKTDIEFFRIKKVKNSMSHELLPTNQQLEYIEVDKCKLLNQKQLMDLLVREVIYGYSVAYISKRKLWGEFGAKFPEDLTLLEDLYALANLINSNQYIIGHVNNEGYYNYVMRQSSAIHSMRWEDTEKTIRVQKKIRRRFAYSKFQYKKLTDMIIKTRLGHLARAKNELNYSQALRVGFLIITDLVWGTLFLCLKGETYGE